MTNPSTLHASGGADRNPLDIVAIETPNLGDRSYVIGRGSSAVVINPQRDIDRVQEILD